MVTTGNRTEPFMYYTTTEQRSCDGCQALYMSAINKLKAENAKLKKKNKKLKKKLRKEEGL